VLTNISGSYTWPKVTPVAMTLGLNGLKLQVHCVPWALEMTSVPLGALLVAGVLDADVDEVDDDDGVDDDDDDDDPDEQAATEAAAISAAVPAMNRRLIAVVLH
jgi:hypothetical protein